MTVQCSLERENEGTPSVLLCLGKCTKRETLFEVNIGYMYLRLSTFKTFFQNNQTSPTCLVQNRLLVIRAIPEWTLLTVSKCLLVWSDPVILANKTTIASWSSKYPKSDRVCLQGSGTCLRGRLLAKFFGGVYEGGKQVAVHWDCICDRVDVAVVCVIRPSFSLRI